MFIDEETILLDSGASQDQDEIQVYITYLAVDMLNILKHKAILESDSLE